MRELLIVVSSMCAGGLGALGVLLAINASGHHIDINQPLAVLFFGLIGVLVSRLNRALIYFIVRRREQRRRA